MYLFNIVGIANIFRRKTICPMKAEMLETVVISEKHNFIEIHNGYFDNVLTYNLHGARCQDH
jgi:hypothetical protein